uniref:Uncharacterized protein n=1 Tax=Pleurocladia lacustris TaxID=246121 RepID=A0A1I9LVL0_9PHAE|nr:hypothetical protein [Pleurocladia lacustris]ANS57630.1 hypothetical protein [Pleurocladia lacustris]ANS57774.1 hypothetical protein [Pleurocladia lacustris]
MNDMMIFIIISIVLNILLISIILIRSPNEISLKENLTPFNFFASSSSAEKSIDNLIIVLITFYFLLALIHIIQGFF